MDGLPIFSLAFRSLMARKFTALLTIISIATAVFLFSAVENIRKSAEASFQRTIDDTDLIVGARSSAINLTLYTVFQIGDPTNNITWRSYEEIRNRSDVEWTVPISLGDSHRGFRVVGTSPEYFEHYKFANSRDLTFRDGRVFDDLFDIVLGAQVARDLGYEVGTALTLSHGIQKVSFSEHSDKPFVVTGVLSSTGTPVDRSVFVSLAAIEAIHVGWQSGTPTPASRLATPERLREMNLQPKEITALLLGAKAPVQVPGLQRYLNTYRAEPLQAVIPGIALRQLWDMMSVVERALLIVSSFVIAVGLIGVLTSILTSLNERRREMAILRSVGARPAHIVGLLVSEAALLAFIGAVLGVFFLYGAAWALQPILEARFNIGALNLVPGWSDFRVVSGVTLIAALLGLIPALIAMKRSLSDGLTVRV